MPEGARPRDSLRSARLEERAGARNGVGVPEHSSESVSNSVRLVAGEHARDVVHRPLHQLLDRPPELWVLDSRLVHLDVDAGSVACEIREGRPSEQRRGAIMDLHGKGSVSVELGDRHLAIDDATQPCDVPLDHRSTTRRLVRQGRQSHIRIPAMMILNMLVCVEVEDLVERTMSLQMHEAPTSPLRLRSILAVHRSRLR